MGALRLLRRKEAVVLRFDGANGSRPFSGLVADGAGNPFGVTYYGGCLGGICDPDGCGTVFELTPLQSGGWAESVIYAFRFGTDGFHPWGSVVVDRAGDVFGTTRFGGTAAGTVFELTPPAAPGGAWTKHLVYNFHGGEDGSQPVARLVMDAFGDLYGTTLHGGFGNGCCGIVFRLVPPSRVGGGWTESVLFRFGAGGSNGAYPKAGMVLDSAGNLYGTTAGDLRNTFGTVFELAPPGSPGGAWVETDLFDFNGAPLADGFVSYGTLIRDGRREGRPLHWN